ncbi:MAG: PilZ domain-containing protein [Desulfomonile tiedjei]|nr:PilZ domain-containing protein [Desulfomonile tiedjei]
MTIRRIDAKQLLKDVKAGRDDGSLSEKYGLTPRELLKVLTRLVLKGFMLPAELAQRKSLLKAARVPRQRQVSLKDIIHDIRSGMGDIDLQRKYDLSAKSFLRLVERLVDTEALSPEEAQGVSSQEMAEKPARGQSRRAHLKVPVPIYDVSSSAVGLLRDISKDGFRVAGIPVAVGDLRSFRIPVDLYMNAEPLVVTGECRWVEARGQGHNYVVAGFQVTNCSNSDERIIREFMGWLLFSDSGHWEILDERKTS